MLANLQFLGRKLANKKRQVGLTFFFVQANFHFGGRKLAYNKLQIGLHYFKYRPTSNVYNCSFSKAPIGKKQRVLLLPHCYDLIYTNKKNQLPFNIYFS